MAQPTSPRDPNKPYPETWEQVADLRVFRASADDWDKLSLWQNDMRKRGWKLLRVTSDDVELVAVFGKTKPDISPTGS
jgi:hypothetical protein